MTAPGEFLFLGVPLVIVWREGVAAIGIKPRAVLRLVIDTPAAGAAVPIFTDLDLANRFLAASGKTSDLEPFRLASLDGFAALMAELQKDGVTHAAIDPTLSRGVGTPIRDVIDGARRAIGRA